MSRADSSGARARRRPLIALLTLIVSAGASAPVASAQDPNAGRLSLGVEQASFVPPLGLWDPARHRASVLFLTKPLPRDAEAASRQAGRWDVPSTGAAVLVELTFAPGGTSAMAERLTACQLTASGFRSRLELKGGVRDCHVISIGGLLRPDGLMIGLLEGKGPTYALRLPFSVVFTGPSIPPNTVAGTAEYAGQRLTLRHALAWWHAANH